MNQNLVILAGNVVRDIETKKSKAGKDYCQFTVATTFKSFKKDEEDTEITEFHNCVAFGRNATVLDGASPGTPLYVSGKLKTDSYEKDGVKKYTTKVMVDTVVRGEKKRAERKAAEHDDIPF